MVKIKPQLLLDANLTKEPTLEEFAHVLRCCRKDETRRYCRAALAEVDRVSLHENANLRQMPLSGPFVCLHHVFRLGWNA